MNLRDLAGIPLGLVAGAAMSVAVSCAWAVLHLPARLQDMFQAGSPRLFSLALLLGLLGASLGLAPVLLRRFQIMVESAGIRWVMLVGKTVGALLGCLLYTL